MRASSISKYLMIGMLVVVTGVPSLSYAQSSREMENRLDRLENEVQTLNHAMYRGGGSGASVTDARANANAEIRMQQIETEMRDLRGQLEQQSFEIRQLRQEVESMGARGVASPAQSSSSSTAAVSQVPQAPVSITDMSMDADSDSFSYSSHNGEKPVAADGTKTLGTLGNTASSDSAAALYENAFALLKGANYDAAEKEFAAFLDAHPQHVLAGNAKYWLGETYYVRGHFEKAARNFAEGFQAYPNGSKAADNLLKLGLSLANLDKVSDACVALAQLSKEGYKNAAPVLRRAEQERARLKCES